MVLLSASSSLPELVSQELNECAHSSAGWLCFVSVLLQILVDEGDCLPISIRKCHVMVLGYRIRN